MRTRARDVWLGPRPLLEVKDPDVVAPVRQGQKNEAVGSSQGPQELI